MTQRGGGGAMLRLVKLTDPKGAEQVQPAGKDETPMKSAEEAAESYCRRCWRKIAQQPFYRVNDNLYHATCTKTV